MNEETLKEAWELFIKERELSYSSNLNPWEMFKAGFIAGTKQNLNKHLVMQAEGSDVSEGAAVGQRSVVTNAEAWGLIKKIHKLSEYKQNHDDLLYDFQKIHVITTKALKARKSSEGHL